MHRLYFILSILAPLLAECAGSAVAQSNDVVLTDVSEEVEPTAIPEVVSKDPPEDCP